MVWDEYDAAWRENLAAAREYFAENGTLAAPRTATALDRPIGQWLSNQRRPGTLAGHPERAQALAEIDPDWNPTWPIDWQRHYTATRECLDGGAQLDDLLPGVTVNGADVGRWLERQRQHVVWHGLSDGQRERLEQLGIQPLAAQTQGSKGAAMGALGAFERGVAALRQYQARTGSVTVPRSHVEELVEGGPNGGAVSVRLGVWISNTKTRRATLTPERLAALAELGLEWAT
jgi:Helicase associated domain